MNALTSLMVALCFSLSTAVAQDNKIDENEPDVRINVQKHYDDQGNVIGIDSTYSLSWSSTDLPMNMDSLFESLGFGGNSQFHLNFPNPNDWMGDFNFEGFNYDKSFDNFDSLLNQRESFNFEYFQGGDLSKMMEDMSKMLHQNMQQFHQLFNDDRFEFFRIDPNTGDSLNLIKPTQPRLKPGQKRI